MTAAYQPLVRTIARTLRRKCDVSAGARVLVATSGGADSVALLRAMHLLADRRRWGLRLVVGHVQHHLRDDAEADARFVEALARELDLPFERADIDPRAAGDNLEAAARRARYDALGVMATAIDARFVATAHHGDDQLETLLMRLMRGASVRGMSGMRRRRPLHRGADIALVRPMLDATHADAVALCRALGQPWREDHTNADVSRTRARLRADVLPVLRELHGDVARKGVRLADHLHACAILIDDQVHRAADRVVRDDHRLTLDRIDARRLPRVVLTGLLRRLLTQMGVPRDDQRATTLRRIARAVDDARGGQRMFHLRGCVVTITRHALTLTHTAGNR